MVYVAATARNTLDKRFVIVLYVSAKVEMIYLRKMLPGQIASLLKILFEKCSRLSTLFCCYQVGSIKWFQHTNYFRKNKAVPSYLHSAQETEVTSVGNSNTAVIYINIKSYTS